MALSHQKEFYWKILGSHMVTGQLWESGQAGWGNEKTNGRARGYLQTHLSRTELLDSSATVGLHCSCTKSQFSSVAQSCPTLCDSMNHSTPGLPVHHQLPEFTQTRVHRVSDAIQPSHPQSSPSPPAPNPSQHQSLF